MSNQNNLMTDSLNVAVLSPWTLREEPHASRMRRDHSARHLHGPSFKRLHQSTDIRPDLDLVSRDNLRTEFGAQLRSGGR